jgi:aromatase
MEAATSGTDVRGAAAAHERSAVHSSALSDPARGYRLVADVTRWPLIFPPCVAAEVLVDDPARQRIRLWATVGGRVATWTSTRVLDEDSLRISFRQDAPNPPLTRMSGSWSFHGEGRDDRGAPTPGAGLSLAHHWAVRPEEPEAAERVAAALDANSESEIAAVTRWSEPTRSLQQYGFSFTESLEVAAPPSGLYAFLRDAELWPERLPHVAALELDPAAGGRVNGADVQFMRMHTRGADGSVHTTESIRLCFDADRIVYKQTSPPHGLLAHTGEWTVRATGTGTALASTHHVVLDPDHRPRGLEQAGLEETRAEVRRLLGGNSLTTMRRAKAHAEQSSSAPPGGQR